MDRLENFDDYGWETATDYLARFVELEPKKLRELQGFVKNQAEKVKCRNLVLKLYALKGWNSFAQGLILEMANPTDQPFVRLMLTLAKERFNYNPMQMHLWWRRVKALDQHNIITYFNLAKFCKDNPDKDSFISWTHVVENCSVTQEILTKILEGIRSNKDVEMNLRSRLGISMSADIDEAWKKWAKANHPDKGGDLNNFVITKACYEEWRAITTKEVQVAQQENH